MLRRKHNIESLERVAKKYETRTQWFREDRGSYEAARRRNLLDLCCSHMVIRKPGIKKKSFEYTVEQIQKIAKTFDSRTQWREIHKESFLEAERLNFFKDISVYINNWQFMRSFTKEECVASTHGFNSLKDWRKHYYQRARWANLHGWLPDCEASIIKAYNYTETQCIESFKKYGSYSQWSAKEPEMAKYARMKGWYKTIKRKIKYSIAVSKGYTLAIAIQNSLQYSTLAKWEEANRELTTVAKMLGWYPEIKQARRVFRLNQNSPK